MKYRAIPVIVTALPITEIRGIWGNGNAALTLEGDQHVEALPDMTSRVNPAPGDYWVTHDDGFVTIVPKKVFEKRYKAETRKKA